MSDATPFAFGKLIPGFDFLQQLATGGGARGASGLGHWVAPTVNVEELEQRITELKAVQFWLEQNLLALKATVQALEVQKMTLATLRGMNLNVAEVARAFTLPTGAEAPPAEEPAPAASRSEGWPFAAAPSSAAQPAVAPEPEPVAPEAPPPPRKAAKAPHKPAAPKRADAPAAASGAADPMQWWGALTQQFQQIAGETLRQAARAVPTDGAPLAQADVPGAEEGAKSGKAAAGEKKPAAGAKKAKPRKTVAKKKAKASTGAKPTAIGWPLPAPFKTGRR